MGEIRYLNLWDPLIRIWVCHYLDLSLPFSVVHEEFRIGYPGVDETLYPTLFVRWSVDHSLSYNYNYLGSRWGQLE